MIRPMESLTQLSLSSSSSLSEECGVSRQPRRSMSVTVHSFAHFLNDVLKTMSDSCSSRIIV